MSRKYITELDGVRAVAALMVLVGHFFAHASFPENTFGDFLHKILSLGQIGVTIFFVLSGYLISRILVNTKEDTGFFSTFYMRRFLRIFPLYYLFLIIVYFLLPSMKDGIYVPFKSQIWYWLYVQNISDTFKLGAQGPSHFWSLAIEEQFYLIWPLLIFIIPKVRLGKLALITILGGNFIRIGMLMSGIEIYYFTLTRMDELALGALLAHLEINKSQFFTRSSMLRGFIVTAGLVIIVWLIKPGSGVLWIQIVKYPLFSISSFFFIGWIISERKPSFISKLLNSGVATYSGKISYGLYVYHPLCFSIVNSNFAQVSIITKFLMAFSMTYLFAALSYRYFELPILKLKRYFSYSKIQYKSSASEELDKSHSSVKITK